MLNAWGQFPPVGLFEGTYGDIGSFHGCMGVPENPTIGHAHYCTLAYRPLLPRRPDYELIVRKEPSELLHLFNRPPADESGGRTQVEPTRGSQQQARSSWHSNSSSSPDSSSSSSESSISDEISTRDSFTDLLLHAQYNHYVYLKLGTCFPIQCSPLDVQRVARLLGRQSILLSGPVKCHSKFEHDYERDQEGNPMSLQISTRDLNGGVYIWKPHMTQAQWVSLLLLAGLTALIFIMTLADLLLDWPPAAACERQSRLAAAAAAAAAAATARLVEPQTGGPPSAASQTKGEGQSAAETRGHCELLARDTNNNNTSSGLPPPAVANQLELAGGLDCSLQAGSAYERKGPPLEPPTAKTGAQLRNEQREWSPLWRQIVRDFSVAANLSHFLRLESCKSGDIECIDGIRCITMSWIIVTHTMQYNDWSAFARTREIETHLRSLVNQPIFNGSYLVDTFFLISGLLTSLSAFTKQGGQLGQGTFSARAYLAARYLRLTPQVALVSLLFILLPQLSQSGSPHWYTITGEYSENCAQNWWVNLLHVQAFYRSSEMCNFVSWWISVDMFYHLIALVSILAILRLGHQLSGPICGSFALLGSLALVARHYQLSLPPNLLSTIPQTGAMWSEMTLRFFWTPYAHSLPFLLGFYLGHLMATRGRQLERWFTRERATRGWLAASLALLLVSYSTHFWVVGSWRYTRPLASLFYLIAPLLWAGALAWTILACHYKRGGHINALLSCPLFKLLSKASYLVYLSHFLVLFTFFGSQNLLIEPTRLVMFYVILGNICLSMLLGSLLCVVYELPWLRSQRRLMRLLHC